MSTTEHTQDAARHEWDDALCTRLEKIIIGRHASRLSEELTDQGVTASPHQILVTLGAWSWLPARISLGRKGIGPDGRPLLMPVRVTWSSPNVLILDAGQSQTLTWSLLGLGHEATGELTVCATATTITTTGDLPAGLEIAVAPHRAGTLMPALDALVKSGHSARWEAVMSMERYVESAVKSAITRVSVDVLDAEYDRLPHPVLDATSRDHVRDNMLLGAPGSLDGGQVQRILDRCMGERAFINVEPLKYIVTDLQRSAEAEVRRAIDDPYIGRKIRRVQRDMPSASLDEVIAEYRLRHPGDALSRKRAVRALSSARDAMSGVLDVHAQAENHASSFNLEAAVLERLEPGVAA